MTNKELVLNFYRDVWNPHDKTLVPQYVRKDYVQHNPTVEQGRDGLMKFLDHFFALQAHHEILLALEDGDLVAVYVNVSFADGSRALVTDIYRVQDGMLAEHWDCLQVVAEDR